MDDGHFQLLLNPIFLFLCFYILTAIWIYYDATKHNIGKLNDRSALDMTAGMWAFGTMLAGVAGSMFIAFPSDILKSSPSNSRLRLLGVFIMLSIPFTYLWNRSRLIKSAETSPIIIGTFKRILSLGIFCVMGGFIILAYVKAH